MHAADGSFMSLADLLRSAPPSPQPASPVVQPSQPAVETEATAAPGIAAGPSACGCDRVAALRDARIFRAALADAFAASMAGLLDRLGAEVLGRELRLAPADVETIARRLLLERRSDEPLRLCVAAADASVACDLPVVVDAELMPGDAVLECRSGAIDARLSMRLAAALGEVRR